MWEFLAYVALTVLLVLVGVLVFAVYRLQRELEGQNSNYVPGRHRLNGQESPSANRRSGDLHLDRRREARRAGGL